MGDGGGLPADAREQAAVLLDDPWQDAQVDDCASWLVDQFHHLAHGWREGRTSNHNLAGLDDRRVVSFVEERPRQTGLVLAPAAPMGLFEMHQW